MKTEHIVYIGLAVAGALVAYHLYQKSKQQPPAITNSTGNAINSVPSNGNQDQRNDGTAGTVSAVAGAVSGIADELSQLGQTFGGF